MAKAKLRPKKKPPTTTTATRKTKPKPASVHTVVLGGLPDETEFEKVAKDLSASDKRAFSKARHLLTEHLGSDAAARLWLVTPGTGFKTTALDAVREGLATVVLETLESQWGESPSYA